jgi:hypothetical protein
MEDKTPREICEDNLMAIADELDEANREKAFQLIAMFSGFLLLNMKGAGSVPVSSTGSSTPSTGMICPKCKQSIKVIISP